jgi:hypothetical protein
LSRYVQVNYVTLIRFKQNPSYLSSKDITPVVKVQVNYVYLMRSTQNPSYLSSKEFTPVVTGQVNYVYLDKIHAESLVSLLKRHYPGCHGTGKLCLDEIHAESLGFLLKRQYPCLPRDR